MKMQKNKSNGVLEQLDLLSVCSDVIRQWWVILAVALSVMLFVNVYLTRTYEPQYTSTATFAVTAKGMNTNIYQNLTTTKELAVQFSNILESNVLKNKVMEELNLDTYTAVTSVSVLPETNLIEVSVTAKGAMEAYQVMDALLRNYNSVSDYVISNVILEEVKAPEIPVRAANPLHTSGAMKRAFLYTAIIVALGIALLSYFKDTVKNSREATTKIDTPLIGTIYHERKVKNWREMKEGKKTSMTIDNPLLSFRFVESNKMVASQVSSKMKNYGCKVLMVTSVAENEGKSTVAANLALALAQEHKKVLLVDFDFRKPALYKIFEEEETADFLDMLDEPFGKYKDSSLYVLFNKQNTTKVESYIENGLLQKLLHRGRMEMDYIILDTSPMALVSDTEELAGLADATVVVVRRDGVLAKDINDAIDALERNNGKVLGCIFNDAMTGFQSGISGGEQYYKYGYGGRYGYGKHRN